MWTSKNKNIVLLSKALGQLIKLFRYLAGCICIIYSTVDFHTQIRMQKKFKYILRYYRYHNAILK